MKRTERLVRDLAHMGHIDSRERSDRNTTGTRPEPSDRNTAHTDGRDTRGRVERDHGNSVTGTRPGNGDRNATGTSTSPRQARTWPSWTKERRPLRRRRPRCRRSTHRAETSRTPPLFRPNTPFFRDVFSLQRSARVCVRVRERESEERERERETHAHSDALDVKRSRLSAETPNAEGALSLSLSLWRACDADTHSTARARDRPPPVSATPPPAPGHLVTPSPPP